MTDSTGQIQTEECHWRHFIITMLRQLVKNLDVPFDNCLTQDSMISYHLLFQSPSLWFIVGVSEIRFERGIIVEMSEIRCERRIIVEMFEIRCERRIIVEMSEIRCE